MLSTKFHGSLRHYEKKGLLGLSQRTIVFSAMALAVTVGVAAWAWAVLGLSYSSVQTPSMILASPFWCLAFVKIAGLRFEEWLPLELRHLKGENKLCYVPAGRMPEKKEKEKKDAVVSRSYGKLRARRGIELWGDGLEY